MTTIEKLTPSTVLLSLQHSQHGAIVLPANTDPHYRRCYVHSINADILIQQLPSSFFDKHRLLSTLPCWIRILELESGTGLVEIAAAAFLSADVTITNLVYVIPNLNYNLEANSDLIASGSSTAHMTKLGWGSVEQMEAIGREYDVILHLDVVYHDHFYEPLMETLRYFLLGGGERTEEVVFVMAHLKSWKKEAAFFKRARKFFCVEVIYRDLPSCGKRVGVIVYRFVGEHCQSSGFNLGLSLRSDLGLDPGPNLAKPKVFINTKSESAFVCRFPGYPFTTQKCTHLVFNGEV